MLRRVRQVVVPAGVVLLAGLAIIACEPVDEPLVSSSDEAAVADLPVPSVEEVTSRAGLVALEWHERSRLVETTFVLGADRAWVESSATFLAPGAARMLVVTVGPGGVGSQQPTLATLGFESPTERGLEDVPAIDMDIVGPELAAEAAGASGCVDEIEEVLYATGAPAAWSGDAWTSMPAWTVSVIGGGRGVRVEADGSLPDDACFELP